MLNDTSVASAGFYIRTCRRIRNSKKIATIRDFHQNICVNPTINDDRACKWLSPIALVCSPDARVHIYPSQLAWKMSSANDRIMYHTIHCSQCLCLIPMPIWCHVSSYIISHPLMICNSFIEKYHITYHLKFALQRLLSSRHTFCIQPKASCQREWL